MWVNKVKIRAIVDTGAPINVISTRFAKRLGIAPDLDYRKEFGTAGTQSTTAQGAYSALPLRFGLLSVAAPAIVLPNQNYNFLFGTAFIKQFNVTICHKNHLFTIFGQNIPLHYSAKSNCPSTKTVNLVYADGVIPVPYSLLSRTYRGPPPRFLKIKDFRSKACLVSHFLLVFKKSLMWGLPLIYHVIFMVILCLPVKLHAMNRLWPLVLFYQPVYSLFTFLLPTPMLILYKFGKTKQ